MNTKEFFPYVFMKYAFGILVNLHLKVEYVTCAEVCDFGGGDFRPCDYGCCSDDCCPYSVSTSVLIVAGIVGGLIVVALVVAIVICLVKTYRDKRAARVRNLRPGHNHSEDHILRRPAEPRKPPEYTEQPPPYSSEMPESHYRPVTVAANYFNYNTRYRTPAMQNYPQNRPQNQTSTTNSTTTNSGIVHGSQANQNNAGTRSRRIGVAGLPGNSNQQQDTQLPGAPMPGRPPTYTEQPSNPTETQRRRRFIQTPPPGPVVTEGANTALGTVSELSSSDTTVTNDEQSETRQSSLTTNSMTQNRSDIVGSRNMNNARNQSTSNGTNIINTQYSEPDNAVIIGQFQLQTDLNRTQNAQTPHTHRSAVTGQSNTRRHVQGHTSLETAISRARNRQSVTTLTPQRNQVSVSSPQRHRMVSVRQADSIRTTTDANNADIEELACL